MSYCLINGTRYYKDDQTGKVSVDNVSQEEADRRARQKSVNPVFQDNGGQRTGRQSAPSVRTAVAGRTRAGSHSFSWVVVSVVVVAAAILGAVYYNSTHVSNAEQAIDNYMQQETAVAQEYSSEAEEVSADSEAVALQAYSSQGASNQDEDSGESVRQQETSEDGEYILPDSDSRYLVASEISGNTHDEIQLMINEIYARHGRPFTMQPNIDYFNGRSWYHPVQGKTDEQIVSEFNSYEKTNVDLLSEYL